MEFSRALGTEVQEVRDTVHEGQAVRAVQGSRLYATEASDLWDALTNVERIPRWFSPISGDLKLGGRYQIEGNAGGKITHCDPPESLELTWEFGDNVSWVSVRLEPEGTGTRLTLVHSMLKDEASEAHWATYGAGATGVGWDLGFWGLGLHLENGEAVDHEAAEAWLTTEPGKVFVRALAGAWGKAHAAGGEEAAVADAMAERTARFYLGE